MSTEIINRMYNATLIEQWRSDRYMNATAMCQANGKQWVHYLQNKSSQEYANELRATIGIPIVSLIEPREGHPGGPWVHPRIAIHLAQWCSARFAVSVSGWIEELLTTGSTNEQTHTLATAVVDIHSDNYGYYSVLAWGRLHDLSMDTKLASIHGRKLSKICRDAGRQINSVHDVRFGLVNSYPEDVLTRYFDETEDK